MINLWDDFWVQPSLIQTIDIVKKPELANGKVEHYHIVIVECLANKTYKKRFRCENSYTAASDQSESIRRQLAPC